MFTELITERLESLKAGIVGSLSLTSAFMITTLANNLILANNFQVLGCLNVDMLSWHLLISCGVASFSGLLFGVTYRYIIREDKNPQLKLGGVLAFGLTRSLAQIEAGLSHAQPTIAFLVLSSESILWFSLAAFVLDTCLQLRWLKPFKSF